MLKQFFVDEQALQQFAKKLAPFCSAPLILFLIGDLGAGKTTFARSLLQALGISEKIKSPTYPIVESYQTNQYPIFHFDLYRIQSPFELDELGIDDYFNQTAIFLIEWPERSQGRLPIADLEIIFEIKEQGREVTIKVNTEKAKELISRLG